MSSTVLFRTDASTEIGTGHMMRCLALGEALQDMGSTAVFLSSVHTPSLVRRLEKEQMDILQLSARPYGNDDAEETAEHAQKIAAKWIVVDGYHFDAAYQDALKRAGKNVLFIDDYAHAEHYSADCVLNQNVYASEELYHTREPHIRFLLGTRYVLLRKEFQNSLSPGERVRVRGSTNVLITLGGFGDREFASRIESQLRKDHYEVRIASGTADMPSLMQWADVAVSAGGTTVYELASMGVPSVLLVRAVNQHLVAEGMAKAGCAVNLGLVENVTTEDIAWEVSSVLSDTERRQRMTEAGRRLVDGEGAERVAMELTGAKIRIRAARSSDTECLWTWANDRETRRASFSPQPIPWENHTQWFAKRLRDTHTLFFIGVDRDDIPLGYARFEGKHNEAIISIAIAPHRRGQGYGSELLRKGCRQFFQRRKDARVSAYVRPENKGSTTLFQKTGFSEQAPLTIQGNPALHFVLQRGML